MCPPPACRTLTTRRAPSMGLWSERYHRHMAMMTTDRAADRVTTTPSRDASSLVTAAHLFHGLSDPSRLAILRHLTLGEHKVVDLTQHLGLAQSTVSKHLACLRDCGLVTSRPQGRSSMFRLTHPAVVVEVLAAGDRLLALTDDTCLPPAAAVPVPTASARRTAR